jgi:hypothetical protein
MLYLGEKYHIWHMYAVSGPRHRLLPRYIPPVRAYARLWGAIMTDSSITILGRDLAELNDGFLELVVRGSDAGLPACVRERLRGLGKVPRRRLAAVPLALFSLGFEDEAAWAGLLSLGVRDLNPAYHACEPPVERFTLVALMALRGLARTAPQTASAWIGLPPETRSRLAATELGSLSLVAPLAACRLRGCFASREAIWLRLLDAAGSRDERQLGVLAALGKQWTIRGSLGLSAPSQPVRGFRR